tara:strand:+ start:758 stop:1099 length:342 start_codon:yes stop_codon:yes gene_type:complete
MSESEAPMEQFNINELAGATGLILGAVGGILAIIFKSRCYCKFRIGCSDKFNLCMCERKPPPDNIEEDEEDPAKPKDKDKAKDKDKGKPNKLKPPAPPQVPEPEPEPEIENLM